MVAIGLNTNVIKLIKNGGKTNYFRFYLLDMYCLYEFIHATSSWNMVKALRSFLLS